MVHEDVTWRVDLKATSNRVGAIFLDGLRPGHTPLLRAYADSLDLAVDPTCPLCMEEPQIVER